MTGASSGKSRFGNRFQGFKDNLSGARALFRATERRELAERLTKPILRPGFIPERYYEGVTRSGQWFAAVVLAVIIPASLTIIVAIDEVIVQLFLNGASLGTQTTVLSFLVNLIGLFFFVLAAWSWFLWVRTGGFKFFEI